MKEAQAILATGFLGGWEIVLLLAIFLLVIIWKHPHLFWEVMTKALSEFGKSTKEVSEELDKAAHDAGRSLGGIHGRAATEALTPDNQVREMYDKPQFRDLEGRRRPKKKIWQSLTAFLRRG